MTQLVHTRKRYRHLSLLARFQQLVATHRSRRALARLDARLLRDVGLTQDDARCEVQRPFWDVPLHWRG